MVGGGVDHPTTPNQVGGWGVRPPPPGFTQFTPHVTCCTQFPRCVRTPQLSTGCTACVCPSFSGWTACTTVVHDVHRVTTLVVQWVHGVQVWLSSCVYALDDTTTMIPSHIPTHPSKSALRARPFCAGDNDAQGPGRPYGSLRGPQGAPQTTMGLSLSWVTYNLT